MQLLKRVVTIRGSGKFNPFIVYPMSSLTDSLKAILSRPGVIELCEKWRENIVQDSSHLRDIFDGKMWSDFGVVNGEPFLTNSGSIGVILNIDWFQPFKHRQYSIGVIYLVILNLPREVRYKREIPNTHWTYSWGPVEPPKNINSYLAPLVTDLLSVWHGVPFNNNVVRCALLCIAHDIPAGRKTWFFKPHSKLEVL